MKSLVRLYKVGKGPSSSHTLAPFKATKYLQNKYPNIISAECILYGSLALTGKGHYTDIAIKEGFGNIPCNVIFDKKTKIQRLNPMLFKLTLEDGKKVEDKIYSIGGGEIEIEGLKIHHKTIYRERNLTEIQRYCKFRKMSLYDYIVKKEGSEIYDFGEKVFDQMISSVEEGLKIPPGVLPGGLNVSILGHRMYEDALKEENESLRLRKLVASYAFAVGEYNALGGILVTAPTFGSSGVMPSLVKYLVDKGVEKKKIIEGILVGGLIGNVAKQNASVSGAQCGCQAEIGVACSMGSAMLGYVQGFNNYKIERCAEVSLEHHLGMTCDPVKGLVQIPCIERNAVGALSCIDTVDLVSLLPQEGKVSYDNCLKTMYETGRDLKSGYRETAKLGLTRLFK